MSRFFTVALLVVSTPGTFDLIDLKLSHHPQETTPAATHIERFIGKKAIYPCSLFVCAHLRRNFVYPGICIPWCWGRRV